MSLDAALVQRLSNTIAQALAQTLVPLNEELEQLRAEVEALRADRGNGGTHATVATPRHVATPVPIRPASRPAAVTLAARRPSTESPCRVPRCEAPVLAKELCETHYRIMRRAVTSGRRFDPAKQQPATARPVARECAEADCAEGHYARGLCRRHYMTLRARERAAERGKGGRAQRGPAPLTVTSRPASAVAIAEPPIDTVDDEAEATQSSEAAQAARAAARATLMDGMPYFQLAVGGESAPGIVAMPTAEAVMRVLHQYRGGLGKVAEVLGRNRQTLMELLDRLNLLQFTAEMREQECQRILRAPLRERLADLLFREKLLDDLKCLKQVDDSARTEVQVRCAQLAKTCSTQEEAFAKLASECGLEESGLKRLIWRYDLRRQLRTLKSTRPAPSRVRG
jgi:hypothetical protein